MTEQEAAEVLERLRAIERGPTISVAELAEVAHTSPRTVEAVLREVRERSQTPARAESTPPSTTVGKHFGLGLYFLSGLAALLLLPGMFLGPYRPFTGQTAVTIQFVVLSAWALMWAGRFLVPAVRQEIARSRASASTPKHAAPR